jgi:hypothetical protein
LYLQLSLLQQLAAAAPHTLAVPVEWLPQELVAMVALVVPHA